MEVAKGTLFSSPREPGLALPPFLELPLLRSSPGKAPPALGPCSRVRSRADPQAPADWACSPGRAAGGERVGPAPRLHLSRGPPPAHRPRRAPGWRGGHSRGRRQPRGGRRGTALGVAEPQPNFFPEVPHLGAGAAGRGGESGVPGRSGSSSSTTWPPPPPHLPPAPRAPLLRR